LALPSRAMAFGLGGYEIDTGARIWFNVRSNPPWGPAGPWYLYWPYPPSAQVAPLPINPLFPPRMTLPPGFNQPPLVGPPLAGPAPAFAAPAPAYMPPPPRPAGPADYYAPPPTPGGPAPQPPIMYRPPVPTAPAAYWQYAR